MDRRKIADPVLTHPPESSLDSPFAVNDLTTNSKHLGPVALGFPKNVIDGFGKYTRLLSASPCTPVMALLPVE